MCVKFIGLNRVYCFCLSLFEIVYNLETIQPIELKIEQYLSVFQALEGLRHGAIFGKIQNDGFKMAAKT